MNKLQNDPNKRIDKIRTAFRTNYVDFVYPEHFTNQQAGFTPVGSAKLHFQIYRRQQ